MKTWLWLCKFRHSWQFTGRSKTHPNPTKVCLRCDVQQMFVFGVGWMSVEDAKQYDNF